MAELSHEFESTLDLGSDSDDSYVTEIAENDMEDLKTKFMRCLSEKKWSACIVHKEGQPAEMNISLDGKKANMGSKTPMRSKSTKQLFVTNVPPNSDKEHLQMFFEYEKGQGGGRVKQVTINDDRSAIIEFEEANSVDVVLRKAPIKMLGETVDVKAFVPYLEAGEIVHSVNINGLPSELSQELVSLSLIQSKGNRRELKVGDRVRVKRSVQKPVLGWGGVSHMSLGTITYITKDNVSIQFPQGPYWNGRPEEVEIAE